MSQPKVRHGPFDPNVLDAVRLSMLSRSHQVGSIASMVRRHPAVRGETSSVDHLLGMLVATEEVDQFRTEVREEVRRQHSISSERKKLRLRTLDLLRMGSKLTVHQRLNRLCPDIFGRIETWSSFGPIVDRSGRAVFNWLKRDESNTMIAGVDQIRTDECLTGFVVRRDRSQPALYATLPVRPRSFRELMVFLGLPLRFLDGRPVGVDWDRREFIVSKTNSLPWVYP